MNKKEKNGPQVGITSVQKPRTNMNEKKDEPSIGSLQWAMDCIALHYAVRRKDWPPTAYIAWFNECAAIGEFRWWYGKSLPNEVDPVTSGKSIFKISTMLAVKPEPAIQPDEWEIYLGALDPDDIERWRMIHELKNLQGDPKDFMRLDDRDAAQGTDFVTEKGGGYRRWAINNMYLRPTQEETEKISEERRRILENQPSNTA